MKKSTNDTTIVDKSDVLKMANLSMLKLTEKEIEILAPQLNTAITYVEKLSDLETSSVPETHQVNGLTNVTRKDEVSESLSQEEALSNAYAAEEGFFKVPGKLSEGVEA